MTPAEYQSLATTLRPRLLAQATRYLHDTAEAEDVVTFLRRRGYEETILKSTMENFYEFEYDEEREIYIEK